MSEKKPGLLRRLFRFGSKKETPEPQEDQAAIEAARLAEQEAAEAERLAKEQLEQEEAEQAAAELAAEKAEAERIDAEQLAAEKKAKAEQLEAERQEAEAKRQAEKKAAEAAKLAQEKELAQLAEVERVAAEKVEARRLEAEKRAADEAEREAAEQRAAEEKQRLKEEAAAEKAQLETERLEAEQREQELEAKAQRDAQEAADRIAKQREAEHAAAEATEQAEAIRLAAESLAEEAKLAAAEQERLDAEEATREQPPQKRGWLTRMREGLSRSSNQLTENITAVFTKRKLDEDTLQDLEDILIQADLGIDTATNITETLASQRMGKDISDEEVRSFMADEIEKVLDPVAAELELDLDHTPHVILVVGVNGSGKTTTIGKLSQKLYDGGFSTLLVAGDTFRAAAIEQLKIWGDRTQSPVVSRPLGSDAAGLAYDAFTQARLEGQDVMLMDTAGRLQNKTELMDELEKIIRVLKKQDPTAPHTVLLTLDATTGQNALNQVEIFKDVAGVNGLVMTKMDGTARGGIMVAIANKFKLPVYFIGVGEQVDDLEPFEAREFARSIAGLAEPE